ncbi:MAG: preprotein translocase subunit SecA [Kiritimatiellia bacterium]
MNLIHAIFGTKQQRDRKRLLPLVMRINAFELEYQSLADTALVAKTAEFRDRVAHGETLDDILPEAFAVVKNACRRLCGTTRMVCGHEKLWEMIPFDVQLMGGIVLHQGKIAEMQTGEGKTLVATLPMYLNALAGHNVHLVTVNDYLALRDAQWMGSVYEFLGLTVGCIQNTMDPAQRRAQYACDITYGTNSEFGFDYLRDNGMAVDPSQVVQRGHNFAIVDEVDSILIDEARTPLIISGPAANSSNQYMDLKPRIERLVRLQQELCNRLIADARTCIEAKDDQNAMWKLYQVYHGMPKHKQFQHLLEDTAVRRLHEQVESMMLTEMRKQESRELREELYFTIDERNREASLTDKGCSALNPADPEMFVLPDLVSAMAVVDGEHALSAQERNKKRQEIQASFMDRSQRVQNVDQLLKAYCLYERDAEYVVQDNRVLIVDEFTGRILPGRRWSDGLHQAVEAKEGVEIEKETQTLATITIQNYFRLYKKLAGMTGTAETEASEFHEIYKLDVVSIPTNRPIRRVDTNDLIFKTQREKFKAVIEEVTDCHKNGQPVLLGTVLVETSELLSRMLRRANIPHNVLNAKNFAREAEIVALAGQPGQVTIATNMAGRGTDIKLGPGVVWLDERAIKSAVRLDDSFEQGKSLRHQLLEKPCGLHVIGSERHESRRIDRQLRGRCARQGDPGSSRFYISLEDELMRLFGSDKISGIMTRLGMQEGEALEHRWLNRSVETAQRRVEQQNFSIRKRTLEYDDVMNKQREVIYAFRQEIVCSTVAHEKILDVISDLIQSQCERFLGNPKDRQEDALSEWVVMTFPVVMQAQDLKTLEPGAAAEILFGRVQEAYEVKCSMEDSSALPMLERHVVLSSIDTQWQEFLRAMDDLRHGVGLRAYGQRDPLVEYKREAFQMFEELMANIKLDVAQNAFRVTTSMNTLQRMLQNAARRPQRLVHEDVHVLGGHGAVTPSDGVSDVTSAAAAGFERAMQEALPPAEPMRRDLPKVGRNDACPCGSGKKFKKCCGLG